VTGVRRRPADEFRADSPNSSASNSSASNSPAPLLWLLAPFVFYLVPFLAGYGWSAIGPLTPAFAGMPTAPGRPSDLPTAVEHYGTGVVVVPFQARLRAYLRDGELPLWNPYSGLGQPFAAQGEGSPYFPLAVVRSLLPTSWSNLVTFVMIGLSALGLYAFLRLVGLSAGAAAFGGAAWALSGQFALNVARNNYADQFAMIPPVFMAAAWAISPRRPPAYVVFALVVALHGLPGLIEGLRARGFEFVTVSELMRQQVAAT